MEDKDLVQKILQGDKRAEGRFYSLFKPKLLSFVSSKIPAGQAEEIVQDIFLSALGSLPLYSFKSSLYSWILGIARHEIADYYRKKKIKEIVFSRLPFLKKLVSTALSPQMELEEKELKRAISRSFASLSEGYARILRLKYIDGCSVAELADKLGVSYKSAESKLFRARTAFKYKFGKIQYYQVGDFIGS